MSETHTYPEGYPKDSPDQFVREAWEIMDTLKPGVISDGARDYLAGRITAALYKAYKLGKGAT